MATNIEITAQLNQMLVEQNKLLLVQAKIQKGQLAIMQQMAVAMGQIDVNAMNESLKGVSEQLTAAEEAAKQFGQTTQASTATAAAGLAKVKTSTDQVADALEAGADAAERYKVNIAAAAAEGAIKGFQFTFSALKGIGGILDVAIRKFSQFAMAVIRFPIGIWNFLFEKATSGGGGGGLREALEGIRKEFGDLSTNSSKAIIDMAKSMQGPLANTGLSVYRTFGNLAERLKYIAELAKALGPLFNNIVARGLIKSAEATLAFQKGLGLSNEQMKTVARTALISGTSVDESLREMSNYAIQLGDAFGLNAMEISRDMAEMEGDMKHFGGLTRKELGETAAYAKKLGIEVKSLAGIMDTFDNLDSAAEAAARLNQQFGIQIETMRMLKAESPAERLEYLRKQMERTGQSFERLDRRSQQYLASTINLTQEEAALVFAQQNRGLSLDQIKKKSAEAEKKQLTQAEALQKLAGSIERLVKGGGGGAKSLFEAFVQGFERAIFRSREFRQIMRNIRIMLRRTRLAGMEVGRAFVDMFPGVKGIMGGLADLFNPERWKRTMSKVVDTFKNFFKDLQTNPEAGLKNLFDRLKKTFFDHFDASSGAGRKLIENFKLFFGTILKAVVGGLKALIPVVFENLTKLINGINSFLKGEVGLPIDASSLGGQVMQVLTQIWEVLKQAWPPLWEAIKGLFTTVFAKVQDWYETNKLKIWGFLFGPAIARSIAGAIASSLTQAAVKGIGAAATSSAVQGAGRAFVGRLTGVTQLTERDITFLDRAPRGRRPPPIPAAARRVPAGATTATGGLTGFINTLKTLKAGDIVNAGLKLVLLTTFLTIALAPFVIGFIFAAQQFENISAAAIMKTAAAIIVMGGLLTAMTGLTKILSTVNPGTLGPSIVGLASLSALVLGLAGVMWLSIKMLGGFEIGQVGATILALGAGSLLMVAMAGTAHVLAAVGTELAETAGIGLLLAGAGLVGLGALVLGLAYIMRLSIEQFNGIKEDQVTTAVTALNAGALLMLGMAATAGAIVGVGAAIAAVAAMPGGIAAMVVGMVAVGGLVYSLVPIIKGLMSQIRDLPPVDEDFTTKLNAVNSVLNALGTFANIFVKVAISAALVTMLPLLLGMISPILLPLGAILAVFTAYKLPKIFEGLVDIFGGLIRVIAENVNVIQPDRLRLLEALGPVMESVGVLVGALQPSGAMLLTGSLFPAATAETIRTYFEEIMPVLTGPNGLISLAAKLTGDMGAISTRNFNVEAVKGFGAIMSSIGSILQAFSSIFAEGGEGAGQLVVRGLSSLVSLGITEMMRTSEGGDAAQSATKLGAFTKLVSDVLGAFQTSNIFASIKDIIRVAGTSLAGLTKEQIEGLGPITQMLSSMFSFMGTLIENMKVDPEAVKAVSGGASTEGINAARALVENIPGNMATAVDTVLASIQTKIGPIISSLLNATVGYSKAEIERAAAGAGAVVSLLTGFGTIMTNLKELGTTESLGVTNALSQAPPPVLKNFNPVAVTTMITSLSGVITAIFGSGNAGMLKIIVDSLINSGISRLPRGIGEKAKAIVDILGLISIVADPTFKENIGKLAGSATNVGPIGNIMQGAAQVIGAVVNNIGALFTGDVSRNLSNFNKSNIGRLENVTQVLSSVSGVVNSINSGLAQSVTQATTQITTIGGTIGDMISQINLISEKLNSIEPINIMADLQRVGNVLGVGRNSAITIRNDNFTITVNLTVTLDARDLEAVLVERSRQGRNRFVLGADRGTASPRP